MSPDEQSPIARLAEDRQRQTFNLVVALFSFRYVSKKEIWLKGIRSQFSRFLRHLFRLYIILLIKIQIRTVVISIEKSRIDGQSFGKITVRSLKKLWVKVVIIDVARLYCKTTEPHIGGSTVRVAL